MFQPKAKQKTRNFLRHIELLGHNSSDRLIDGYDETERVLIKQFIAETSELIENNESGVGLQNLLTNIYEIEFIIDNEAIELAKDAISECKMDYADWKFIEELVK